MPALLVLRSVRTPACKAHHLREPWASAVVAHLRSAPKHRIDGRRPEQPPVVQRLGGRRRMREQPRLHAHELQDACDLQTMEVAASFYDLSAGNGVGRGP